MSDLLLAAVGVGVGLLFLVAGGEFLVRGASALAAIFRIPPLVIGLTVVAFCTSAPELAVSVQAVYAGSAGFALVMTGFVLPLTVVTLIVCMLRASHASPTSSD